MSFILRLLRRAHPPGRPVSRRNGQIARGEFCRTRGTIALAGVAVFATSVLAITQQHGWRHHEGNADVAARELPAVVSISVLHSDIHEADKADGPAAANRHRRSVGSGVIVDRSGVIVTNAHVISGKGEVRIALQSGEVFRATLIGQDPEADIAVLRAEGASSLPTAIWGDSRRIRPGDPVLAIGNPFGFGGTVTAGIVSAVNRDIHLGPEDAFIQTDANINPGNSGGPLLNSAGEIIGINTALIPAMKDGGSVGLGFAIPSADAKPLVEHLLRYGRAHPGWIGVRTQPVTSDLAAVFGLARLEGALVSSIEDGSPAAGVLNPGDVILKIGEMEVGDPRRLSRSLATMAIGQATTIRFWRAGREMTATVEVVSTPDNDCPSAASGPGLSTGKPQADLGLVVAPLTDNDRNRLKLAPQQGGVAVQEIVPFSAAADLQITPGSVVEMVGMHQVSSPRQVDDLIEQASKEGRSLIGLLVQEPGGSRWAALPLEVPRSMTEPAHGRPAASDTCSSAR